MANSGIYVKKTKISEITGGKIDFELKVRIINLWSTPDRANPADDGALHMIFLDNHGGKIYATIRKDLISKFKEDILEGSAYVVERFMVGKNDSSFKITSHKHKLNFMQGTKVVKVNDTEIPLNHFDFMPFQDIISSTKEDQFLDAIGHVVEKNAMKETNKNGKISKVMDVILEDLEGNRVHCTLWGDYAVKMHQFLDTHDPSLPVIVILQLCKLKRYFGAMGISNSFYGTKLFINAKIPEVASYIDRMNAANVELTQVVSQMSGPVVMPLVDELLQSPRMTIEDLIEATQKCCGSVLAWTCEFDTDAGWCYQACTRCASRINFIGGQLYCDKCKMPRTVVPRFKVHLQVIDDTGSITFIMFDRVVSQFLGRTAQDILDAMNNDAGTNSYPSELDVFVDKRMLFKVEVTDANLYRNWRGYTVKKVTGDEDIINRFSAFHGINVGDGFHDPNCDHPMCDLGADTPQGGVEGVDSTNNEETVVANMGQTPTSKSTAKKTLNYDVVGSAATKEPVGTVVDVDQSPNKQVAKKSVNTANEDLHTSKAVANMVHTPTSKSTSKKALKYDVVGSSATKQPVATVVGVNQSPNKQVGKRSANAANEELPTSKETRLACVKIEGAK